MQRYSHSMISMLFLSMGFGLVARAAAEQPSKTVENGPAQVKVIRPLKTQKTRSTRAIASGVKAHVDPTTGKIRQVEHEETKELERALKCSRSDLI
jgi:hypothetical protein